MTEGNILLLFLTSAYYRKTFDEISYTADDGNIYKGVITNDASSQYLLKKSVLEGTPINKVFCITSKNTALPIPALDNEKSSYDMYVERLKKYANENLSLEVEFYKLDYDEERSDKENVIKDLLREINGEVQTTDKNIYIEYTGGMRDIAFFMVSIMKYLKIKGLVCKDVVYAYYQTRKIYSINDTAKMFEIISGVDEFKATGRTDTLLNISEVKNDKDFMVILNEINDFTKSLTVNDISEIENKLLKISNAIRDFQNAFDTSMHKTHYTSILNSFIPSIKEGMYLDQIVLNDHQINYPALIEWCVKHNLIQQAMVLYVEKLPKYYAENDLEIRNNLNPYYTKWKSYQNENMDDEEGWKNYFYNVLMVSDSDFDNCLSTHECSFLDANKMFTTLEQFPCEKFNTPARKLADLIRRSRKGIYVYGNLITLADIQKMIPGKGIKLSSTEKKVIEEKKEMLFHYIIFNDEDLYFDGIEELNIKKYYSVEYLKKYISNNFYEKLLYYLAIRISRNQMLHVMEENEQFSKAANALSKHCEKLFRSKNIPVREGHIEYEETREMLVKAIEIARIPEDQMIHHGTNIS